MVAVTAPDHTSSHNTRHQGRWWMRCCTFVTLIVLTLLWSRPTMLQSSWEQQVDVRTKSPPPAAVKKNATENTTNTFDDAESHVFTIADFPALVKMASSSDPITTWDEEADKRQPILDLLNRAGLKIDLSVLRTLPTWEQVTQLYGSEPVIFGKETCQKFRDMVPPERRFAGVAGQMNTGTNALAKYFRENLAIRDNPIMKGMLWTVPWYKHGWVDLRHKYMYRVPDHHELVMPVVVIRDPYFWMNSMCQSPYTMEWNQSSLHCPNLVEENSLLEMDDDRDSVPASLGVPVWIRWSKFFRQWHSLAHVWSDWYREYVEADFPRLIIRFEDLLFHTETVMEEIRECVGADWVHEEFVYQTKPAKTHPYFEKFKKQSGLVTALAKYGRDDGQRTRNMTLEDQEYASEFVGKDLLDLFRYHSPV